MKGFQKGDAVQLTSNVAPFPELQEGEIWEFERIDRNFAAHCQVSIARSKDQRFVALSDIEPVRFPILAAKDPWRESEPNAAFGLDWCHAKYSHSGPWFCSRVPGHAGHHIARSGGTVVARWLDDAPHPEKRLPRKGDKVVLTRERHGYSAGSYGAVYYATSAGRFCAQFDNTAMDFSAADFGTTVVLAEEWEKRQKPTGPVVGMEVVIEQLWRQHPHLNRGDRGRVDWLGERETFHCLFAGGGVAFAQSDFGKYVVPAAEWDAREKKTPAPVIAGKALQIAKVAAFAEVPTGDLNGPTPRYEFTEAFAAKLAIAIFEDDNAAEIARAADDGCGGIGTEETRARCVWRSTGPQREAYLREAAALLKRAGELE